MRGPWARCLPCGASQPCAVYVEWPIMPSCAGGGGRPADLCRVTSAALHRSAQSAPVHVGGYVGMAPFFRRQSSGEARAAYAVLAVPAVAALPPSAAQPPARMLRRDAKLCHHRACAMHARMHAWPAPRMPSCAMQAGRQAIERSRCAPTLLFLARCIAVLLRPHPKHANGCCRTRRFPRGPKPWAFLPCPRVGTNPQL